MEVAVVGAAEVSSGCCNVVTGVADPAHAASNKVAATSVRPRERGGKAAGFSCGGWLITTTYAGCPCPVPPPSLDLLSFAVPGRLLLERSRRPHPGVEYYHGCRDRASDS
jgi:hypothetical protein